MLVKLDRLMMTSVCGHSTFPTGAGYSFDNNGNYIALGGSQTLSWNHENRLSQVVGGGIGTESYLRATTLLWSLPPWRRHSH